MVCIYLFLTTSVTATVKCFVTVCLFSSVFLNASGVTDISLLFEGEEDHLIPSTLGLLVDSDLFVVAGRIIGHCFLHEGPQLHGLSNAVVHLILHNDRDTATVELADVADLEVRSTLQKVNLTQVNIKCLH